MIKNNCLIVIAFLFSFSNFHAQLKKSNYPNWVEKIKYNNLPNISENEISQGLLNLLSDQQVNEINKETFYRYVTKITENVGVQAGSSINISYDPSYQKLEIHEVKVIRNGNTINKLNIEDFQLIRREMSAETYIYDGSLSAITNLSDIRIDDIIDYSFTIKGFNPVHKNHFATSFFLNSYEPIGQLNISIITNKKLDLKYLNTKNIFKKSKNKYGTIYKITDKNIKPCEFEENTPSSEIILSTAYVSDYSSWKQVTNWGVKTYRVSENLSKKLLKKISAIKSTYKTEGEQINATLNFVQDEVRYLGLESGIGAYKPHSPNKVFEQRFGDCKDKSLLMVTMLNAMNIEAYPMLVNTYLGNTILNLLPSHNLFDHCVVKVKTKKGRDLWYDTTISNQGGDFKTVTFPDYRVGLVLKKGNDTFDEITSLYDNSIEITDNYVLEEVGKGATLNTATIYKDSEADAMRAYFQNNSINAIKKEYENFYTNYFFGIKSLENPRYEDDIEKNTFKTFENYKIDSIWELNGDNQIQAFFYPYAIINALSIPTNLKRERPYALKFPATRRHNINIKLPRAWNLKNNYFDITSNSFYYDYEAIYNNQENFLSITHFLRMQEKEVTTEEFTEFYNNLKKIDTNLGYGITIPKSFTSAKSTSFSWTKILGFLLFIAAITGAIFLANKIFKYDPEPEVFKYYEKNKNIGGWLILIAVGLFISPFKILYDLLVNPIYINGDWLFYFNTGNSIDILIGFVGFIELLYTTFILIMFPYLIILFLKKRSSFPKIYSFILIGVFLFTTADTYLVNTLINVETSGKEITDLIRMFISAILISAYLIMSERSKETFLKRYKEEEILEAKKE